MFNSRKPEGPQYGSPLPDADKASVNSTYSPPVGAAAPKPAGRDANYSIINEWLTMRGDLESEGDILIKGRVFGNIRCKLLIIDIDAQIEGGITADEVVVRGRTKGTIAANKVRLEKTASVDSEISHVSFSAEEGARIKGSLKFREEAIDTSIKMVDSKAA